MGTLHQTLSIPNVWIQTGITKEYSRSVKEVGGIDWRITLIRRFVDGHVKYICGLKCLSFVNAPVWSCVAGLKLTLESGKGVDDAGLTIKKIKLTEEQNFTFPRPATATLELSSKVHPDIPSDEWVSCSVELTVIKSNLQRNCVPELDFCSPEMPHDRVLLVKGRKFYVQSSILSMCSSFFNSLLRWECDVVDGNVKEITLEDVEAEEFNELLMHLYPVRIAVNVLWSSVASLLQLADRFDIPLVTARCGWFLANEKPNNMDFLDVVDLITKYKLVDAQAACMEQLDQYGRVDDMISTTGPHRARYFYMSEEAKLFILEAVLRQRKETRPVTCSEFGSLTFCEEALKEINSLRRCFGLPH